MNRNEFVSICANSGYASKSQAKNYAADRESFDDKDIEAVYRKYNEHRLGGFDSTNGTRRRAIDGFNGGGRTTRHYLADGGEEGNR